VWLGGAAPAELRRVGRVGDGWLPSFCSPADVADGIPLIEASAAEHGRTMDPQHYGALISYSDHAIPDRVVELVHRRSPGSDPRAVIPTRAGLPALLREMTDAGASKFVIMPLGGDADPVSELGALAQELLPLST
jgi:hypothetical protein